MALRDTPSLLDLLCPAPGAAAGTASTTATKKASCFHDAGFMPNEKTFSSMHTSHASGILYAATSPGPFVSEVSSAKAFVAATVAAAAAAAAPSASLSAAASTEGLVSTISSAVVVAAAAAAELEAVEARAQASTPATSGFLSALSLGSAVTPPPASSAAVASSVSTTTFADGRLAARPRRGSVEGRNHRRSCEPTASSRTAFSLLAHRPTTTTTTFAAPSAYDMKANTATVDGAAVDVLTEPPTVSPTAAGESVIFAPTVEPNVVPESSSPPPRPPPPQRRRRFTLAGMREDNEDGADTAEPMSRSKGGGGGGGAAPRLLLDTSVLDSAMTSTIAATTGTVNAARAFFSPKPHRYIDSPSVRIEDGNDDSTAAHPSLHYLSQLVKPYHADAPLRSTTSALCSSSVTTSGCVSPVSHHQKDTGRTLSATLPPSAEAIAAAQLQAMQRGTREAQLQGPPTPSSPAVSSTSTRPPQSPEQQQQQQRLFEKMASGLAKTYTEHRTKAQTKAPEPFAHTITVMGQRNGSRGVASRSPIATGDASETAALKAVPQPIHCPRELISAIPAVLIVPTVFQQLARDEEGKGGSNPSSVSVKQNFNSSEEPCRFSAYPPTESAQSSARVSSTVARPPATPLSALSSTAASTTIQRDVVAFPSLSSDSDSSFVSPGTSMCNFFDGTLLDDTTSTKPPRIGATRGRPPHRPVGLTQFESILDTLDSGNASCSLNSTLVSSSTALRNTERDLTSVLHSHGDGSWRGWLTLSVNRLKEWKSWLVAAPTSNARRPDDGESTTSWRNPSENADGTSGVRLPEPLISHDHREGRSDTADANQQKAAPKHIAIPTNSMNTQLTTHGSLPLSQSVSQDLSYKESGRHGGGDVISLPAGANELQQSLRATWHHATTHAWFDEDAQAQPRTALRTTGRFLNLLRSGERSTTSFSAQPMPDIRGTGHDEHLRTASLSLRQRGSSASPYLTVSESFGTGYDGASSSESFGHAALLRIPRKVGKAMGNVSVDRASHSLERSVSPGKRGRSREGNAMPTNAVLDDRYRALLYQVFQNPPSCCIGDLSGCFEAYKTMVETSSNGRHVLNWKELSLLLLPEDYIDYKDLFPPYHFLAFPNFVEFVEVLSVRHRR